MMPKPITLLVAVSVIFIGVILLLGNMGVIPNSLMALWPVILIVAGLIGLTCTDGKTMLMKKKKK
jgi:uncharacterized membrane protein